MQPIKQAVVNYSQMAIIEKSVLRAKHKIQCFIENNEIINLTKFLASWRGHVGWADTHNLITYLDNKYDYANY